MKYVALYLGGKYQFGFIDEEGRFEYKSSLNDNGFCIISDGEFEKIKTFNIPDLGYNKLENGGYEIFDKKIQEYDKYEVPVLTYVFDKMVLTEKKTFLFIPTNQTVEEARKMYSKIMDEIFKYEHEEEIAKLYKEIDKGGGIAFVKHEDYPYLQQILYRLKNIEMLFSYQYESYVVGIKQNDPTKYLKLEIPEYLAGKVIGKGGTNIKEMAKNLGVKRIEVKSLQD